MARKRPKPACSDTRILEPAFPICQTCGKRLWMAYYNQRKLITLNGILEITIPIRSCRNPECAARKLPIHPYEEGALALPEAECALDLVAFVGNCRHRQHRSIPEIHALLQQRDVPVCQRTVTNLLDRYDELVALSVTDKERLKWRLRTHKKVVLAIDGLQPDVGNEILWVVRDLLSQQVLLARTMLSATTQDLASLLQEVADALPADIPVVGVVSDGQVPLRKAVAQVFPAVPHQLCQFHYLREAARPIYEADRHAKKELKKRVRGIRPLERQLEERTDPEAKATVAEVQSTPPEPKADRVGSAPISGMGRVPQPVSPTSPEAKAALSYAQAVRSALTDDGAPPLEAPGLELRDRLQAIVTSIARVEEKGGPSRC